MTHKERILRHLKDYGSITTWEAITEYGCTRLGHYIYLLRRKDNYNITDEIIKSTNRYGDATHYKKYNLNLNQEK
jgi:hypothetical protein